MQEFTGGSLGWHGSQSVQRGEAAFVSFVEQLRNALALFLIERRDKTFPKTLLRPIPDAADKAFEDADARQPHFVDDQPGRGALDEGAGVVVSTPAQRIKPSGQAKPDGSIASEIREFVTISDQCEMPFALTPDVKIALEGRTPLQAKLADQESRYRIGDFYISARKDADESRRSQHEGKAGAVVVVTQPIGDLPVASVQMEIP